MFTPKTFFFFFLKGGGQKGGREGWGGGRHAILKYFTEKFHMFVNRCDWAVGAVSKGVHMGGDLEGCAAEERKRSKSQAREGGREEGGWGRCGGGVSEREESTPKFVSVAWEVIPLQLPKIRQTIQGSHQTLPAHFLLERPR